MPDTPGDGNGSRKSPGSGFRILTADELGFFAPETPASALDTPQPFDPAQSFDPPTLPDTFADDLPNAVVDAVITTAGLLNDHVKDPGSATPLSGSVGEPDFDPERKIADFEGALKQAKAGARNPVGRMLLEQNTPHMLDFVRGHVTAEADARKSIAREDSVRQCIDTLGEGFKGAVRGLIETVLIVGFRLIQIGDGGEGRHGQQEQSGESGTHSEVPLRVNRSCYSTRKRSDVQQLFRSSSGPARRRWGGAGGRFAAPRPVS
jgi:hypothetical protein